MVTTKQIMLHTKREDELVMIPLIVRFSPIFHLIIHLIVHLIVHPNCLLDNADSVLDSVACRRTYDNASEFKFPFCGADQHQHVRFVHAFVWFVSFVSFVVSKTKLGQFWTR